MVKVLDPTRMVVTVTPTDGDYPITIRLEQTWYEAGVEYMYWKEDVVGVLDAIPTMMTSITSDLADIANS